MFQLVDTTDDRITVEFATLAGALSRTRTRYWHTVPFVIYNPDGEVVRSGIGNY